MSQRRIASYGFSREQEARNEVIHNDEGIVGQAAAPMVDVPVTMTCPPNSSLSVSIKASNVYQGSTTQAYAGKINLAYYLYWNSDNTIANVTGVKRNLTNQNGTVDLSLKAKLVGLGGLTEGDFSASAVISIEYL